MERYRIYEKINRIAPSFKEQVKVLNSNEFFEEEPKMYEELKYIYDILCDYIHPTSEKFEKMSHNELALVPIYDPEQFTKIFEFGLRAMDCVQFIYLKSMSIFFGFKNTKEYLGYLSKNYEVCSDMANEILSLPFLRKLSEGITWKTNDAQAKEIIEVANKSNSHCILVVEKKDKPKRKAFSH